jgi:hypothetical protein
MNQTYSPSRGSVHYKQIDKAIEEYKKQIQIQDGVRILVAKGISLKKWMRSTMDERVPNVFFDLNVTERIRSSHMKADLFIAKIRTQAHSTLTFEIASQLMDFANKNHVKGCFSFRGHCMTRSHRRFRLDISVARNFPRGIIMDPHIIFEIEVQSCGLAGIHQLCLEYFSLIPGLKTVVLLKFFDRLQQGFVATAVLYQRIEGSPIVKDAVIFETATVPPQVNSTIPPAIANAPIRTLPKAPIHTDLNNGSANLWLPHQSITVDASSFFL